MSESPTVDSAVSPGAPTAAGAADPKKREDAERVLADVLRLMDLKARLELKDAEDGGISVAVHLEGEDGGLVAGKRSNVADALQFLTNKIINKPNTERRWITIGVGGFPEPRQPKPARAPKAQAAPAVPAASPEAASVAAPIASPAPRREKQRPAKEPRHEVEEARGEVTIDEELAAVIRALAEKSARHGRYYALAPMSAEDRARALKAVEGVEGVRVQVEGEGRARRLLFVPANPAPMPRPNVMPDYDEEEDEA